MVRFVENLSKKSKYHKIMSLSSASKTTFEVHSMKSEVLMKIPYPDTCKSLSNHIAIPRTGGAKGKPSQCHLLIFGGMTTIFARNLSMPGEGGRENILSAGMFGTSVIRCI